MKLTRRGFSTRIVDARRNDDVGRLLRRVLSDLRPSSERMFQIFGRLRFVDTDRHGRGPRGCRFLLLCVVDSRLRRRFREFRIARAFTGAVLRKVFPIRSGVVVAGRRP